MLVESSFKIEITKELTIEQTYILVAKRNVEID